MRVEMINIDILNDKAMYYNIFTEKKNGRYFIIEHTGKIGNKGVKKIVESELSYDECKDRFYNRVNKKKLEHYRDKKEIINKLNDLFGLENYCCDVCGKHIEKELYFKIEKFMRYKNSDERFKNKVLCFKCQEDKGIYQREEKKQS